MNPDDLLDYQLGQLDEARREQFEQELAADPELANRSARLALSLVFLLDGDSATDPPPDLAARTIAAVDQQRERPRASEPAMARPPFRALDLAVAAGIFLASLATLLPAMHRSRAQMQEAACMFNLQQIGLGLASYANNHGTYPQPPQDYPAGYYAVQLREVGALPNASRLVCPANGSSTALAALPTCDDFGAMMAHSPENCQRLLGDEYAYHAGFRQAAERFGPVPAPQALSIALPILADQPPRDNFHRVLPGNSPDHGGGGQNVLFSDYSVRWLRSRELPGIDDDIYLNNAREPRMGLNWKDVSLIPAGFPVQGY